MNIEEMRKIKEERGLTCEMISEMSGVPLSTVQKIFAGITKRPRYDNLMALERVLQPTEDEVRETAFKYGNKMQGEYTVDDLDGLPDDVRAELIDGEIYYMTAPSTIHQILSFSYVRHWITL